MGEHLPAARTTQHNERDTNGIASVIGAADHLAMDVGPEWGLAIVVAIMLLIPRWGLLSYLGRLWKEDRDDARKQKVASERLAYKYRNRPSQPHPPVPTPGKGE